MAELEKEKLNMNAGVFRDDGLGVSSATPRVVEQMKKRICAVYKKHLSSPLELLHKSKKK